LSSFEHLETLLLLQGFFRFLKFQKFSFCTRILPNCSWLTTVMRRIWNHIIWN